MGGGRGGLTNLFTLRITHVHSDVGIVLNWFLHDHPVVHAAAHASANAAYGREGLGISRVAEAEQVHGA